MRPMMSHSKSIFVFFRKNVEGHVHVRSLVRRCHFLAKPCRTLDSPTLRQKKSSSPFRRFQNAWCVEEATWHHLRWILSILEEYPARNLGHVPHAHRFSFVYLPGCSHHVIRRTTLGPRIFRCTSSFSKVSSAGMILPITKPFERFNIWSGANQQPEHSRRLNSFGFLKKNLST